VGKQLGVVQLDCLGSQVVHSGATSLPLRKETRTFAQNAILDNLFGLPLLHLQHHSLVPPGPKHASDEVHLNRPPHLGIALAPSISARMFCSVLPAL
jgi:hypothetical protein